MASDTEIATRSLDNLKMEDHLEVEEVEEVEEDFSDPKSIVAPASLKELIDKLHRIFAHDRINVDYVKALMESYQSNPKEWKKFAKFDRHRYTRNLVDEGNGKFNLMILCWNEAQGSSIHSHAGSHCFLKVLNGSVKEEMYAWPGQEMEEKHEETGHTVIEETETQFQEMRPIQEQVYKSDLCTYICDDLGLHRVENPSHVDKAVTLHLYSPPFEECLTFDQRTGQGHKAKSTFWSKFGKRTPYGKAPSDVSVQSENN